MTVRAPGLAVINGAILDRFAAQGEDHIPALGVPVSMENPISLGARGTADHSGS